MSMGNGIGWAGLNAIAAKDAARIVDVVNARVAFTGRDALRVGVFGGFDINTARRTCCGAQEAADALLESVFVAMEDMDSPVACLEMDWLLGIVFGDGFSQHIAKCHAETLDQGSDCFASFFNHRWHRHSV